MTFIQQRKVLSKGIFFIFVLLLSNMGWSNHFDSQIPKVLEIPDQESSNLFFTSQRQFSPQPFWGNDVLIDNQYSPHYASSLASNWIHPDDLYCAMKSKYDGYNAILFFKSTDEGHNWSYFGGCYVANTSWEMSSPALALTSNYITVAYIICPTGTSTDTGIVNTYWKPLSGGSGDFYVFPHSLGSDPDLFYSGVGDSLFITFLYWYSVPNRTVVFYRSTDGGYSWAAEYTFSLGHQYRSPKLAYNMYPPNTGLYVAYGGENGLTLSKSTNFGNSWSTQIVSSASAWDIDIASECYTYPSNHLVIIKNNRCYWSSDGGSSWSNYSIGTSNNNVSCDFNYNSHKFVAASILYPRAYFKESSAYPPTGFAGTWTPIDDASSASPIYQPGLCIDGWDNLVSWADTRVSPTQVYCDNSGWGGAVEETETPIRKFLYSFNIFPNPVSSRTFIKYSIPERTKVELKIYDASGKEVATLLNKEQSAGFYKAEWDISNVSKKKLPNGVYFYHLMTDGFTETKKMVIVR